MRWSFPKTVVLLSGYKRWVLTSSGDHNSGMRPTQETLISTTAHTQIGEQPFFLTTDGAIIAQTVVDGAFKHYWGIVTLTEWSTPCTV